MALVLDSDAREYIDTQNISGRTPLMYSIYFNNFAVARALIRAGANTTLEDHKGMNALAYACEEGNQAMVELLLGDEQACGERCSGRPPSRHGILPSHRTNNPIRPPTRLQQQQPPPAPPPRACAALEQSARCTTPGCPAVHTLCDRYMEDFASCHDPACVKAHPNYTAFVALSDCIICTESLSQDAYQLPCTHVFHRHCLRATLQDEKEAWCPVCREHSFTAEQLESADGALVVPQRYKDAEIRRNDAISTRRVRRSPSAATTSATAPAVNRGTDVPATPALATLRRPVTRPTPSRDSNAVAPQERPFSLPSLAAFSFSTDPAPTAARRHSTITDRITSGAPFPGFSGLRSRYYRPCKFRTRVFTRTSSDPNSARRSTPNRSSRR